MENFEFDIYTEFFINVGHIWQERTESVILGLSDSLMMAVNKLEQSLGYHQVIDEKQSQTLKIQGSSVRRTTQLCVVLIILFMNIITTAHLVVM